MFDNVTITIVAFTWGHEFEQTTWATSHSSQYPFKNDHGTTHTHIQATT